MILIDVPMPDCCRNCLCSYWIMNGENEGRLMCNAMEARGDRIVLVDELANDRPEGCPIRLEVRK